MEATQGIALLVGLYMGGISGGLISAILLKIPGTPSSISTVFDGGPMAEKGAAGCVPPPVTPLSRNPFPPTTSF